MANKEILRSCFRWQRHLEERQQSVACYPGLMSERTDEEFLLCHKSPMNRRERSERTDCIIGVHFNHWNIFVARACPCVWNKLQGTLSLSHSNLSSKCVYACACVCMHECMGMCVHVCLSMLMCAWVHVCAYMCMSMLVHAWTHACMRVCVCACMHVRGKRVDLQAILILSQKWVHRKGWKLDLRRSRLESKGMETPRKTHSEAIE